MTTYNKPLPIPLPLTEEFWNAAKRHELVVQRCKQCGILIFYPRDACPSCLSQDLEWNQVSGKGRVYSYTVVRSPAHPGFKDDAPYIYGVVQIDEGPRMITNIVDCKIEDCHVDMPVTVVFDDVTPEITLIKFKPA